MIVEYKGIPVFYREQGAGRVVVLVHGFLETSMMWEDLIPELSKTYRVVALDVLGHGRTGCLGYVHTMEMMAEMVRSVLRHLDIQKAHLVGHSMGGYVALAMAETFPDLIEGLCLMNSSPFADSQERQTNRDRAIRAVKYQRANFVRLAIANLFDAESRAAFADKIEQIKAEALAVSTQGIVAALEGMKIRPDRSIVLRQLQVPKVVLLGRRDSVFGYDSLKTSLETIGVDIMSVSGGHMSHIENKNEVIEIIERMVNTEH